MPPAPTPRWTPSGTELLTWSVSLSYDPITDHLVVVRSGRRRRSQPLQTSSDTYDVTDLDAALTTVRVAARVFSARTLF